MKIGYELMSASMNLWINKRIKENIIANEAAWRYILNLNMNFACELYWKYLPTKIAPYRSL